MERKERTAFPPLCAVWSARHMHQYMSRSGQESIGSLHYFVVSKTENKKCSAPEICAFSLMPTVALSLPIGPTWASLSYYGDEGPDWPRLSQRLPL